jgi:hypothetical protein
MIFGYQDERKVLDDTEIKLCPFCGNEKQFNLVYYYRSYHVYFIPILSGGKTLIDACSNCGRGEKIDFEQAKVKLGRNPIPWLTRYGWTIPFIFVGGLILSMWLVVNLAKFITWAGI